MTNCPSILYRWHLLTKVSRKICLRNYYLFSVSKCVLFFRGLDTLSLVFWGSFVSFSRHAMHVLRALDNFIPDHTLCVKQLVIRFRTSIVAAVGSEQDCKRLAARKTVSGWQQARLQAGGNGKECRRTATKKTSRQQLQTAT